MSDVKRFRFVSPGIFINEIDQSQLPALPARMGPVIIGRASKGPGFRPVVCSSFAEFVEIFGRPVPGKADNDLWRDGNTSGPTYGAYAAQAYLKHSNPVTFVRVLGSQHPNHTSTTPGHEAGWRTKNTFGGSATGGAYGLFVCASGSVGQKATATITFAGNPTAAQVITFTVDGVAKTYVAATSASGLSAAVVGSLTNTQRATALQAAINSSAGHNAGTANSIITVTPGAGADSNILTLTVNGKRSQSTVAITNTMDGVNISNASLASFGGLGESGAWVNGSTDLQAGLTGSLAAVWYLDQGTIELSGTLRGTEAGASAAYTQALGTSVIVGNCGADAWKVVIKDEAAAVTKEASFSFDPSSDVYIRSVFNTNPTLVNSTIHTSPTKYWLGETFEREVDDLNLPAGANKAWGVILGLGSGSAHSYDDQIKEAIPSETGWIISQDVVSHVDNGYAGYEPESSERVKKLFKFVSIDGGSEWNQNNLKISLRDIKPAKDLKSWPSFSVEIRAIHDNDKNVKPLERFSNCNLNPNSPNYIGRKMGTQEVVFDTTERRNRLAGDYPNKSTYVRVEVNESVAHSRDYVPFGCFGPPRYRHFLVSSGSNVATTGITPVEGENPTATLTSYTRGMFVKAGSSADEQYAVGVTPHATFVYCGEAAFTGTFEYPAVPLRSGSADGGIIDNRRAYFGADTSRSTTSDVRFERSNIDILRSKPHQVSADSLDFSGETSAEYSWIFSLDDVKKDAGGEKGDFSYVSGSRKDGTSYTAESGSNALLTASLAGINRFTTVLYGGFDGLNIKEREPFRNSGMDGTDKTRYTQYSLHKAIDVVKDAERVECNLLAMPGITNVELTNRLVDVAEERGDTLAVIDLESDYVPDTENTSTSDVRRGDVDEAARSLKDRQIDSSYGCCYYPWVQAVDSFDSSFVWMPPSVVALGAMAYSESVKEVWFAPAGFSRGGLTATGAGGLGIVGVNQQLTSRQRDTLYEVGINPIAQFPAEGIVIFGQKTLQSQQSALDRINVRRLLIFLKKEVSRIAATTLFEQNVQATWNSFSGQVETLLGSVKSRLGLMDFKVILDETTTTDDLIDRNILYAKIFLKPARAIEFIALDFFITRSGASFED